MRQNKNKPPMTISITFLYILGNGFFLSISYMIVYRRAKKYGFTLWKRNVFQPMKSVDSLQSTNQSQRPCEGVHVIRQATPKNKIHVTLCIQNVFILIMMGNHREMAS